MQIVLSESLNLIINKRRVVVYSSRIFHKVRNKTSDTPADLFNNEISAIISA